MSKNLLHCFCLMACLVFIKMPTSLAQCPQIVWQDEFEQTSLDLQKWSFQTGDGCDMGQDLCGWGNNELQWYQAENTSLEGGVLKITAKRESQGGRSYTSSRMNTKNKGDWTFGRFEASIKLPIGQGIWPAFWMLPTDEVYGGWPQSGEIDIMELIGQDPNIAHGTIHFGSPWPNNRSSTNTYELFNEVFNDDFHQFAIEWEANEIRWYVDDYLYSTKRRSDTSPFRWPFDRDFHFLLNVAVGGNWPGPPDGSTQFPQTMEVDYVRVYDGFFPYITGSRQVGNQASGQSYQIANLPDDATVTWSVNGDAVIAQGQGTSEVLIDWGNSSASLTANISSDCFNRVIELDVAVSPPLARLFSFENFDEPARITIDRFTGTLADNQPNPAPNAVNDTELVGRYTRNGSQQFDVLAYNINDLGDASIFTNGEQRFFLDVLTDAPVGTAILLQLENTGLATPTNFPRGRHSRFEARTTVQNEWERLEFQFLDQPDNLVPDGSINQMIFLFASNTMTNSTFHFDNFDAYAPQTIVSTEEVLPRENVLINLFPNPTNRLMTIENISDEKIKSLQIINLNGQLVKQYPVDLITNQNVEIDLEILSQGIYWLNVSTEKDKTESHKLIVK